MKQEDKEKLARLAVEAIKAGGYVKPGDELYEAARKARTRLLLASSGYAIEFDNLGLLAEVYDIDSRYPKAV